MRYGLLTAAGEQQRESPLGAQGIGKRGRPEGVRLALVLEGGMWTARSDGGRGHVVRLDQGDGSRGRTGRSCVPLGKSLNPSLPHLLLVGGQAVILLLDLDAPYGHHTPDYSCGQVPGVPATTDTCGVGHGHQGA